MDGLVDGRIYLEKFLLVLNVFLFFLLFMLVWLRVAPVYYCWLLGVPVFVGGWRGGGAH